MEAETVEVICPLCPNGCTMQAIEAEDEVIDVTGSGCMRGYAYAQNECFYRQSGENILK